MEEMITLPVCVGASVRVCGLRAIDKEGKKGRKEERKARKLHPSMSSTYVRSTLRQLPTYLPPPKSTKKKSMPVTISQKIINSIYLYRTEQDRNKQTKNQNQKLLIDYPLPPSSPKKRNPEMTKSKSK